MTIRPPKLSSLSRLTLGHANAPDTRAGSERQRKADHDKHRGSASRRGYDAAWRALRDQVVIERGSRCEQCGCIVSLRKADANRYAPVAHVDHIVSIEERPDLRLDKSNLRTLCAICHSEKTVREDGGFGNLKRRI